LSSTHLLSQVASARMY